MIDPADQRASDEAIKRNTNLTPTGVRQALQETASDFQRRVDAQGSTTPVDSIPKHVGQITTTQTNLIGDPVALTAQNDNQNPFPKNSTGFDNGGAGTASNPYVMGTNRTTTDPAPADDSWTRASGPTPSTGGPYDGVDLGFYPRIYRDPSTSGATFDDVVGTAHTIVVATQYLYIREIIYDSNGELFSISAESLALSGPNMSYVTLS